MQLGQREKDAAIITAIEGLGLHDSFRVAHPALQAWTREPTGELQHTQASRRIDHVFASSELSDNLSTRVGIHKVSNSDLTMSQLCAIFPLIVPILPSMSSPCGQRTRWTRW